MELRNKDVMVYRYDPKKKYFLVSLRLENKPGELGNLANMLGIRGINILEGFFGGMTYGDRAVVGFFVETTNERMDKDWLSDYLKTGVGVSDVEVRTGVEGFLADSFNFPVTWNNGERAVVMRIEGLQAMLSAVKTADPSAGGASIYEQGFTFGKWSWVNLMRVHHPKTKEGLAEMLETYSATGWGKVHLLDLDPVHRTAKVKLEDGFECAGVRTGKAEGHFVSGHLAGAFSAFFGTDAKCEETRCISKGDGHCEFSISA